MVGSGDVEKTKGLEDNSGPSIPVQIAENSEIDLSEQIRLIEAQLRIDELKDAHALDRDWAIDRQKFSILLFKVFAFFIIAIFVSTLYVLLFSENERSVHLATVLMEMILASVIAGFIGYLFANPFEHRRKK